MKLLNNNKNLFKVFQLVTNDMAGFFPYFFVFYITCIIVSAFNKAWDSSFYWPAFHALIVLFAILSLFSENVRRPINISIKKGSKYSLPLFSFLVAVYTVLSNLIIKLPHKIHLIISKNLTKKNVFKIILIALVLSFSLYRGVGVIDSMVIIYALIAILFLPNHYINAWAVLILFVICSILLLFQKYYLAEIGFVYIYYFLIITVISYTKELFLNREKHKIIK